MKLYRAVLVLLFLFVSCGKDNPDHAFFTASFDGSTYNATETQLYMNGYGVFIEASDDNDNIFAMTFFHPTEVPEKITLGLGALDPIGGFLIIRQNELYLYENGTVKITLLTENHIEGNFDILMTGVISEHSTKIKGSFSLNRSDL